MIAIALVLITASAATPADRTAVSPVNAANGVALMGYDTVAYFTTGRAVPGSDAHTQQWKGATYRFASAEHRARFAAEPERYVPQYGGYCAYAMAIDRIADIDPERWAIVDGKLYLNNNRVVHALWSVNRASNVGAADRNWAAFPKRIERP
jgi:YHS domain-containing protein